MGLADADLRRVEAHDVEQELRLAREFHCLIMGFKRRVWLMVSNYTHNHTLLREISEREGYADEIAAFLKSSSQLLKLHHFWDIIARENGMREEKMQISSRFTIATHMLIVLALEGKQKIISISFKAWCQSVIIRKHPGLSSRMPGWLPLLVGLRTDCQRFERY